MCCFLAILFIFSVIIQGSTAVREPLHEDQLHHENWKQRNTLEDVRCMSSYDGQQFKEISHFETIRVLPAFDILKCTSEEDPN